MFLAVYDVSYAMTPHLDDHSRLYSPNFNAASIDYTATKLTSLVDQPELMLETILMSPRASMVSTSVQLTCTKCARLLITHLTDDGSLLHLYLQGIYLLKTEQANLLCILYRSAPHWPTFSFRKFCGQRSLKRGLIRRKYNKASRN